MTVACLLGVHGWQVRVVDKRSASPGRPRAVHLDHHGARILDAAGVMAGLAPQTEPMDAYEWRSAAGDVLLRLQPDPGSSTSGWPESSMFAQPDLEGALESRLTELPTVTVARDVEIRTLADLEALGGWVVGCDGARSTVRALLGIADDDLGLHEDWLIVDVVPHAPARWEPLNVQVCDPSRPTTAVSGGPGRRRWEFRALPGEDRESLAAEDAAWRLLAPWGVEPGNATLERHAVYRFEAATARRWRAGRVLLAGDAAHRMPPFAGQGLCAGLRDAANLVWKLDAVLAGQADPALLDTYGSERSPQVRTEIDFSVDLGRIICVSDPVAAAARDHEMAASAAASGPVAPPPPPALGPGITLPGDPHAGHLGVQGTDGLGGDPGRTDELLGRGWALHGRHGDPRTDLTGPSAAWFSWLGGIGVDCSAAPAPYPAWFAETAADVILVRPDFAVYGTGTGRDAAEHIVGSLREQLGGL